LDPVALFAIASVTATVTSTLTVTSTSAPLIADRSGPVVEVGFFAATPAALGLGQLLGPELTGWLRGPWTIGARVGVGFASENDLDWSVNHIETRVAALAGYTHELGRARASLILSAGGVLVHEHRVRHQAQRMMNAGADADTRGWTNGVLASIEASLRLFVFGRYALTLHGGPDVRWLSDAPASAPRFGFIFGLAIGAAIEDQREELDAPLRNVVR
jgi:hypothetical protein